MYNKRSNYDLPNTEYAGKSIVTLPTHPNLTQNDLDSNIL